MITPTTLTVFANRIGPIRGRHPWVFSGALKSIPNGIQSGAPVILVDEANNFLAHGYFNSYSQIAVRLWSWDKEEVVNDNFFINRIKNAYEIRRQLVESKKTDSFRIINGENDLLPGLIVDKYSQYLSVQFHTPGIEAWKKEILAALKKILKPKGIYERSDVRVREGEESKHVGVLDGKIPDKVKILENGYSFYVNIPEGQKTGFFLDQRDKRSALTKYVKGKTVLNCFSYTGGFSVYALGAGAKKVVSVDVSGPALEMASENMKLNKLDLKKCEFVCEDVKKYLANLTLPSPFHVEKAEIGGWSNFASPLLPEEGSVPSAGGDGSSPFDVIILDPPAFIKDRRKIHEGLVGYRKINEMALRALPKNGILVTASCSAHLSMQDFRMMLSEAAGRSGRTVRILESYTHGIDHPQLVAYTEGEYLKCIFARVE